MLHERDCSIMRTSTETGNAAAQAGRGIPPGDVPLEKVALETYVPPARPSLTPMTLTVSKFRDRFTVTHAASNSLHVSANSSKERK